MWERTMLSRWGRIPSFFVNSTEKCDIVLVVSKIWAKSFSSTLSLPQVLRFLFFPTSS